MLPGEDMLRLLHPQVFTTTTTTTLRREEVSPLGVGDSCVGESWGMWVGKSGVCGEE